MSTDFSLVRVRRVQHLRPLEGAVASAVATAILSGCVPFASEAVWFVLMVAISGCALMTGMHLRAALACALLGQWARREGKFAILVGGAARKELALPPDTVSVEPSAPASGNHVLPTMAAGVLVDQGRPGRPAALVVLIPEGRAAVRVLRFDAALKAAARGDDTALRELTQRLHDEHARWKTERPRLPER